MLYKALITPIATYGTKCWPVLKKDGKMLRIFERRILRMRLMGQLVRMQELDPCRKLVLLEPESTRRIGKPNWSWLWSVEEELKKIERRLKSQD
jgi:hypothetical protein